MIKTIIQEKITFSEEWFLACSGMTVYLPMCCAKTLLAEICDRFAHI